MEGITHTRCFLHPAREAAARCLECRRFFCRECVTEHNDRLICAGCLRKLAEQEGHRGTRGKKLHLALHLILALMLSWLVFYSAGRALLRLPTSFHEGAIWRELAWEVP